MTNRFDLPKIASTLLLATGTLLGANALQAASPASDNAGNYDTGANTFATGANQGTGFQPFVVTTSTNSGAFLAQSSSDSQINSNSPGGTPQSFDLFAFGGGASSAVRPFTGALSVGQSFSIDIDSRGVINDSTVGFSLSGATGTARFTFDFLGGTNRLRVTDGAGTRDIGPNETFGTLSSGIRATFTLTGTDTYAITGTGLTDGATDTTTGTLGGVPGSGLDRVLIFDNNAGPNNDLFFNNLSIVPEPSTYICVLGGLTLLVGLQRRRARRAQAV